jgi:hypothetical protein
VDPGACLDDVEKRKFLTLPGLELRPLGRLARRQSLYRLRCPSSSLHLYDFLIPHTVYIRPVYSILDNNVACRPVARQRPRNN